MSKYDKQNERNRLSYVGLSIRVKPEIKRKLDKQADYLGMSLTQMVVKACLSYTRKQARNDIGVIE